MTSFRLNLPEVIAFRTNVEGKFGAASRDAFTFDGGRSRSAALLTHGEEFVNADAVASSGEGREHPKPLPKSAGT